ncbi:MAG: pseudouridine synthase [Phycisphaerales bacterium]
MDSDDLPILHLDSELVVLDKPAGLLSVPGIGPMNADCLASRVQAVLPDARIVHRLDQATSGVVVMARGAAIHRELSRQFEQREVEKRYIAIVAGIVDADEGEIDLPLRKDMERTARHIVDHERGRPALTRWARGGAATGAARTRPRAAPADRSLAPASACTSPRSAIRSSATSSTPGGGPPERAAAPAACHGVDDHHGARRTRRDDSTDVRLARTVRRLRRARDRRAAASPPERRSASTRPEQTIGSPGSPSDPAATATTEHPGRRRKALLPSPGNRGDTGGIEGRRPSGTPCR